MSASSDNDPPQPWEEEFPIDHANAELVNRREFARLLVFLSGGMAVGTAWVAARDLLSSPPKLTADHRICGVEEVPVGGMLAFTLPGADIPYLMIHLTEQEWCAFEQKCTHLSCAVYFSAASGKIECPCHSGFFDARTGAVLQGPPPRPLPRLEIAVRPDGVYAVAHPTKT
jgi:nitrite reductase/ring-hydroxylating ferredoxin subunit